MKFKEILEKSGAKGSKSYKLVGDILVVKLEAWNERFVEIVRKHLPYIKTILNVRQIEGELRRPVADVIWTRDPDNPTSTIHKEWGILYKIDLSKVMFSKGNFLERGRMMRIRHGKRSLDMFAGIGYFTIPLSKSSEEVVAVEKNPDAFHLLLENIRLNRAGNVMAILSDNRDLPSEIGPFDRIVMGYYPGTEKFLEKARELSHPSTLIHYHNLYRDWEFPERAEKEIRKIFPSADILLFRKVKKAGPRKIHAVIDFLAGSH